MKIGFLSSHNPYNQSSFSGTTYYAYRALQRLPGVSVSLLAQRYHLQEKRRLLLSKVLSKVPVSTASFDAWVEEKNFQDCLNAAQSDLRKTSVDVVIALVASGLISELQDNDHPPIVCVTDAIVKYIEEAYKNLSTKPVDYQNEYRTIQKSSKVVYSSDFMANRAKAEYASILANNPDKIHVVPFGPNLEEVPKQIHDRTINRQLHLLFVGREWHRKGGDVALETLQYLLANKINAHLTIIGSNPEMTQDSHITVIPHLDKSKPEQRQQYFDILNRSHFLILPTRADCTPMVIAEANAFGVPALVSDVGGVGTLVKSGVNGYLFPLTATGTHYGEVLSQVFGDSLAYQQLSEKSRREYETRLNWDAWAQQIYQISHEHISTR